MSPSRSAIRHALTVDVEDWFQVQAYSGVLRREDWERLPRRVERNTDRLLALFEAQRVQATFFTLGWVAERHGPLIRRIVAGGHELASHGQWHRPVDSQDAAAFREDVSAARARLEAAGGVAVRGYRAPTFSVGPTTPWAWDVLAETGHAYSSSVFPIRHDLYGDPQAPRAPHQPFGGTTWEIPMTTLRLAGRNLPCAGGGWFRLMPYPVFRAAFARAQRQQGAGVFYIHPWEIDPGQPHVPQASRTSRWRHRVSLGATEARLSRLCRDFGWNRMDQVFGQAGGAS